MSSPEVCGPVQDLTRIEQIGNRRDGRDSPRGRMSWEDHESKDKPPQAPTNSVFISYFIIHPSYLQRSGPPLAYVRGVEASVSLRSELRGRLWSNHFGWQSLFDVR